MGRALALGEIDVGFGAVAAVVVSWWEGRLDREQFEAALAGKLPPVTELPVGEVEA